MKENSNTGKSLISLTCAEQDVVADAQQTPNKILSEFQVWLINTKYDNGKINIV